MCLFPEYSFPYVPYWLQIELASYSEQFKQPKKFLSWNINRSFPKQKFVIVRKKTINNILGKKSHFTF